MTTESRVDQLLEQCRQSTSLTAIATPEHIYSYNDLLTQIAEWESKLEPLALQAGRVIAVKAEFSFQSITLLLTLLSKQYIVALISPNVADIGTYLEDSSSYGYFEFTNAETWAWREVNCSNRCPLLDTLRNSNEAGFIIFSSGSTGKPKAILHSAERFLSKFDVKGKELSTLAFLMFDHIAGIDTLFYTLSNSGTLVVPNRRDPQSICRLIELRHIEVLPTSPTFLNLLRLSGEHDKYDLSSLKVVTYGSEPMSQSLLNHVKEIFTHTKIIQKYGTSEFGAPRTQSRGDDSLWIKLRPEEVTYKIIDDILWVKSSTSMLGYLNAPSPFLEDGWYPTGDLVEEDGEWIHILGRDSDLIIVGGEKVYPSEVESVVLELDFIDDVIVLGKPSPFTGNMVTAKVKLNTEMEKKLVEKEIRKLCRKKLQAYKVPAMIEITQTDLVTTGRHKKQRT